MQDYTRENNDFWGKFIQELNEEIDDKNLLTPYINKIKQTTIKKEEGHTKAQSYVDFLINHVFDKCETLKKYGFIIVNSITEREHGDFYLICKNTNDKISANGKIGISKRLGQPNICSIDRAIEYLDKKNLPYIIFKLRKVGDEYKFHIFDLYNYLDVVSYNDGPGQLMLSETKFYKKEKFEYLKTSDSIVYLCDIHKEGFDKLFIARNKKLIKNQDIKKKYVTNKI
jgi:hypothetical protein